MASVVRIADYLSFLHMGEIAASGTVQQLLHSDHPATAEFVRPYAEILRRKLGSEVGRFLTDRRHCGCRRILFDG